MVKINSKGYDVEILPNFFSVTFVDMNNYFSIFSDCCDIKIKNGKEIKTPKPLTDKLPISEIKRRLALVKKDSFYITDYDDSQLLPLVKYFNDLSPTKNNNGDTIVNYLYGFNSYNYDKYMIACFLMYATICKTTKELIRKLYECSKKIIDFQNSSDPMAIYHDYEMKTYREYALPFKDVDIMRIFALNKVGVNKDSNGNKKYYGKSLKQTSINIKWHELLEYELPPISELDLHLYQNNKYRFPTINDLDNLNKIVAKWDRFMIPEYEADTMHYNANDVYIVCEICRLNIDEIRLRYSISKVYEVDVMNSSRSNIANILFSKFYSEFSGLRPEQWKGKNTVRTNMSFKRVIFDNVHFKTKPLQDFLNEIRNITISSIGKGAFEKNVTINKLTYTIATGGLHSQDTPRELRSRIVRNSISPPLQGTTTNIWDEITDDSYIYVHADVTSFYPSIMGNYKIAPEHMDANVFAKLILWIRDTRIAAKHSKEDMVDGIPKDVLAQALKIVINSIYGKMGDETSDICDRLAVLKVTINGQLFLLMLCEELELNGIEVVSANTDGIYVKLYKKDKEKYDAIIKQWQLTTKMSLDSDEYKAYINRDINNYIAIDLENGTETKGDYNPYLFQQDLSKGYNMPIVAKAVNDYFVNDKPILESLYEATNILDFCKTQNIGRQFHVEFYKNSKKDILQRNVRFYVSKSGGNLFKVDEDGNINNLCKGYRVKILNSLDDKYIGERDIDYGYYYQECLKLIDPIKLGISPNQKATRGGKTGKTLLAKYGGGGYGNLFENNEDDEL